jgi:NAD(P)H-dependent FMN reductase
MNVLVFLGSRRASSPPNPPRLGERVARHLVGEASTSFDVQLIDPLALPLEPVFRPVFTRPAAEVPPAMAELHARIRAADAYVMVSPEYNHSPSPALTDLLNAFPSSAFAFKPSLIATYSSGQWGGTRAAVGLRTFLSELGCLPVSAMLHYPHADRVFDAEGRPAAGEDAARWSSYAARGLSQLAWWAQAAAAQRKAVDPFAASPPFRRRPTERDAPAG